MKFFVKEATQFYSIIIILFLSLIATNLIFDSNSNELLIESSSLILLGAVSKAELIKKELYLMFDQDVPLRLSSDRTNRFKEICNKFRWDYDKTRTTIQKTFKKVVKERKNLNPIDYGIGKKIPRFNTDLHATITEKPQGPDIVPQTEHYTIQTETKLEEQKQIPTDTEAPAGTPEAKAPPPIQNFDEKGVAASFNAIFLMFRLAYPDLELLTKEEKESLGKVWLPAFNKYMTEKWAIIGIPFLATLGIFLPKIIKARKIKKEKETKENEQKDSQKIPNSNQFKSKTGTVWNDKTKTWEKP